MQCNLIIKKCNCSNMRISNPHSVKIDCLFFTVHCTVLSILSILILLRIITGRAGTTLTKPKKRAALARQHYMSRNFLTHDGNFNNHATKP